jgi:hypothetical protein
MELVKNRAGNRQVRFPAFRLWETVGGSKNSTLQPVTSEAGKKVQS